MTKTNNTCLYPDKSSTTRPGWRRGAGFRRKYGWTIIALSWVVLLVLGYIGFTRNAMATRQPVRPFDLIYLTLQLISMESGAVSGPMNWQLQTARFLLPALAAWTVVRAFLVVFADRWRQFSLRYWRSHIVICGLSRKGWILARSFAERGDKIVILEADEENDFIGPARDRGMVVLVGDATDAALLRRAGINQAQHIIAVTNDDGVNAEIAVRIQGVLGDNGVRRDQRSPLNCTVHLIDPQLCELARARELDMQEHLPMQLELFNVFERGGRLIWKMFPPVPGTGNNRDQHPPHILVVGLGRLGESLVVNAARDWHLRNNGNSQTVEPPNGVEGIDGPTSPFRMRITVIDREANWKCQALHLRYPKLALACDLVPLAMDVRGPAFQEISVPVVNSDQAIIDIVYICFDDDSLGLRTGLNLNQRMSDRSTPIVVRMAETGGLARLLEPASHAGGFFDNIHAFGLLDHTCSPEAILGGTHELLAQAIHEDYVRAQSAVGITSAANPSLVPWHDLPEDLRRSNFDQADRIAHNLGNLGYGLVSLNDWDAARFHFPEDDEERLAQIEHDRFVAERLAAGWRYAPESKNLDKKTSPTLVPWAELPENERAKDLATVRDLPALLAQVGLQIVRLRSVSTVQTQ